MLLAVAAVLLGVVLTALVFGVVVGTNPLMVIIGSPVS
jgi:hypothetical protein